MTRTLRKHSTDMVSLVSGVIFLGVTGTWALDRADLLAGSRGWLLPILLVTVGLAGLIGIRPRRQGAKTVDPDRSDWTADESPADEPPAEEPPADRLVKDA